MSIKIVCIGWRKCERSTLRGFADLLIPMIGLHVRDVAVHEENDRQWVQLPARPQLDENREPIQEANGRPRYVTILTFDTTEAAAEFNGAALKALQDYDFGITGSSSRAKEEMSRG